MSLHQDHQVINEDQQVITEDDIRNYIKDNHSSNELIKRINEDVSGNLQNQVFPLLDNIRYELQNLITELRILNVKKEDKTASKIEKEKIIRLEAGSEERAANLAFIESIFAGVVAIETNKKASALLEMSQLRIKAVVAAERMSNAAANVEKDISKILDSDDRARLEIFLIPYRQLAVMGAGPAVFDEQTAEDLGLKVMKGQTALDYVGIIDHTQNEAVTDYLNKLSNKMYESAQSEEKFRNLMNLCALNHKEFQVFIDEIKIRYNIKDNNDPLFQLCERCGTSPTNDRVIPNQVLMRFGTLADEIYPTKKLECALIRVSDAVEVNLNNINEILKENNQEHLSSYIIQNEKIYYADFVNNTLHEIDSSKYAAINTLFPSAEKIAQDKNYAIALVDEKGELNKMMLETLKVNTQPHFPKVMPREEAQYFKNDFVTAQKSNITNYVYDPIIQADIKANVKLSDDVKNRVNGSFLDKDIRTRDEVKISMKKYLSFIQPDDNNNRKNVINVLRECRRYYELEQPGSEKTRTILEGLSKIIHLATNKKELTYPDVLNMQTELSGLQKGQYRSTTQRFFHVDDTLTSTIKQLVETMEKVDRAESKSRKRMG